MESMKSWAIANMESDYYESYWAGDKPTEEQFHRYADEKIEFTGPYTLIEERSVYVPGDSSVETALIRPDETVVIYDSYGHSGITRPQKSFDSISEVAEWIDETLERDSDGEYAIGVVAEPA